MWLGAALLGLVGLCGAAVALVSSIRSGGNAPLVLRTVTVSGIPPATTVTARRTSDASKHSTPAVRAAGSWIDRRGLNRLVSAVAAESGARVGVGVRTLGDDRLVTSGALLEGAAWSTLKIPLVMARLRLAASERADAGELDAIHGAADAAITSSDNDAAARIFSAMEDRTGGLAGASHYLEKELAAGGDRMAHVTTAPPPPGAVSTWGQTNWSLTRGTEFFRQLALRCVPPRAGTRTVLDLMSKIVPDQRWGIGRTSWAGSSYVGFKGGWGPLPAPGYLVRQFGIVETSDGRGIVIGLITHAGSFPAGQHVLDQLASAVARSVHLTRTRAAATC